MSQIKAAVQQSFTVWKTRYSWFPYKSCIILFWKPRLRFAKKLRWTVGLI
jgi:hypothetical protein